MTPELKRAIDDLKREFATDFANGNIRHVGVTNCRRKNNKPGAPWSEHSWSNAGDIMLRDWSGRKALGDRIAAYMRSRPDLWAEVYWWIAAHYDHVHGTANPRRNYDNKQTPPCAGGKDDLPMDAIKGIQRGLNAAGFKGANGKVLTVDGIWGANTEHAFTAMAKAAKKTGGGVTEARVKALINSSRNVAP